MNWWNGYEHMGWGHMGSMGTWWIVGTLAVIGVVWALVRATRSPSGGSRESPAEIAKRRYAKGEIDRETYRRTLTDLKG